MHQCALISCLSDAAANLTGVYCLTYFIDLSIAATAPERRAKSRVLMRQVQDVLWEAGRLDDAANLDRALLFDEFSDGQ